MVLSFQPKSHDERLQKSNKHLSGFLNEVSDELQANIDKMSTCLQKWNGEEWSRGPFLEVTVKMNKQLISIEDVLKEKCSVLIKLLGSTPSLNLVKSVQNSRLNVQN